MAKSNEFDARGFRDALSSFATGVTIVTATDQEGEPVGMTASSFNSVSTEPPLVLWSVTKTARSAPAFEKAEHFSIHVLASEQTDLSNKFAKSGADKFADTAYAMNEHNVPILEGCAARFDCKTWSVYEGGDHWIIVGEVNSIDTETKEALVFGGGSYAIATPLTTLSKSDTVDRAEDGLVEDMFFYHLSRAYHRMSNEFHNAVRDSGLTVAQWRILASLHGQSTLALSVLAEQTFLDPKSLEDILCFLQDDGLCVVSGEANTKTAQGTKSGHERVIHLFDLAREQEQAALAGASSEQKSATKDTLKRISMSD